MHCRCGMSRGLPGPSPQPSPHATTAARQVSHHGDKPSETTPRSFRRFLIDSPLVAQRPDAFPEGDEARGSSLGSSCLTHGLPLLPARPLQAYP